MKTLDIKKLLLIVAIAFATAAIVFIVLMATTENSDEYGSGFNTLMPEAEKNEMAKSKAEAYQEPEKKVEIQDTVAKVTIRRTLDDFARMSEKTDTVNVKVKQKPKAAKKHIKKSIAAKQSEKIVEPEKKQRSFLGTVNRKSTSGHIAACIHEDQKVKDGDRLRIRITEDCQIEGVEVKAGTIVTATVAISGNRIKAEVRSIYVSGKIIETRLSVFDNDSVEGIFYPESDTGKAARTTGSGLAKQIASTLGAGSSVAGTVIEGGSNYISEKMENTSAKIYGNYRIILVEK